MSGAEALSHVLKFHNAPKGIDFSGVEADQEDREVISNAIHFGFRERLISFYSVSESNACEVTEDVNAKDMIVREMNVQER